jgi:hypothetical protein
VTTDAPRQRWNVPRLSRSPCWIRYGRRTVPEWATDRRRKDEARPPEPLPPQQGVADPVLALQRSIGNTAVTQLVARAPAADGTTGAVRITGVGEIKVHGGNLEEWAGTGAPDTVDVASAAGRHSAKLEKLASARTKTDVKVTISVAGNTGEHLNVGGGTVLEIQAARIKHYAVDSGAETWQLADFENVKRTKTSRKIGVG